MKFDDLVADDSDLAAEDPQATRAAQGFKTIGNAVVASEPVQNVITGKGLRDQQDVINAAVAGDPNAQLALADSALGTVMGTISKGKRLGDVSNDIKQSAAYTPGIGSATRNLDPTDAISGHVSVSSNMFPILKESTGGIKVLDTAPKDTVGRIIWKKGKAPKIGKVIQGGYGTTMAYGGDVPTSFDDLQQDEFTNNSNSQPSVDNQAQNQNFDTLQSDEEKYGTPVEIAKTAAEGFAQGALGPVAPLIERALGINPEDIRARGETNPGTHFASEATGLIAPAIVTSGASTAAKYTVAGGLEAAGQVAAKLGLVAGDTLASKIGVGAAKAAIDNMLLQGSDEVSKLILEDPHQSAETAISNIGLAGLVGGAIGGGFAGVGGLWDATVGDKAGKLIEDFRGRMKEHVENPDPVAAMTEELSQYHKGVSSIADEVYGASGLKAQDIAKAMPEMHEGISQQAQEIYNKLDSKIGEMVQNQNAFPPRLTQKLQGDLEAFKTALSKDNVSPGDVFNATQDLKQTLQGYSKFDKFVKPVDEAYDFVKESKSLSKDLREALEDKKVWGKAAERQQTINKAFSEYLPALKDFEKKFTTEIAGEKVIDPTKINTYLNQVGKPNAEIKQQMLKNFLDASEKYKKVLETTHANLGLESPGINSALNVTMSSLNKKTLGSKLADAIVNKGLSETGSAALGAGTGAGLAHMVGLHGGIGAIIGHGALTPFFKSVLPAIAKSMLDKGGNPSAFKAAVDYALNVAKGETLLERAATNVFEHEKDVLPVHMHPTEKERTKLNKMLDKLQVNPQAILGDNKVTHYMPDNAMAMDEATGRAVSYLSNLKPGDGKNAPLDSKPVISTMQKAKYANALNIAQQPLIVLDKIKKGTLTFDDMKHLSAMYPALLGRMQKKLTEQMVDTIHKHGSIPYKTRIGMSLFLAQPLDTTMMPASIQATQMSMSGKQTQDQQQQSQQQQMKGVKSSPALQKMPNLYQTPGQSREQHKTKP